MISINFIAKFFINTLIYDIAMVVLRLVHLDQKPISISVAIRTSLLMTIYIW